MRCTLSRTDGKPGIHQNPQPRLIALASVAIALLLLAGCRHGVEIKGQGNVSSASGTRDCSKQASPCRYEVEGRYRETFTANPSAGWLHDAWEGCQSPNGKQCRFDIPADTVAEFEDSDIPSVVARFRRPIDPLFRNANGSYALPDNPATGQLAWLVAEARGGNTTAAEIRQRFHPDLIAQLGESAIRADIDSIRNGIDNPTVRDLVTATPVFARALIAPASGNGSGSFVSLTTQYSDEALITSFSVQSNFPQGASNTAAAEQGLSLSQLGARFATLASDTSMLVARIDNDQCKPIYNLRGTRPQPTGSIFKIWVLGALAEEIRTGRISANTMIPLDADEIVPAGATINDVAPGTQFPLREMASLMMGVSDNTATDHIHELVGRERVEATLKAFRHRNRELMTPFLSTNEQFHILWSLPPGEAASYARGSDEQQRNILTNTIEPLGPVTSFPQGNQDALFDSSWAASADDVCRAYAGLRRFGNRSEHFDLMDQAMGAEAVLLWVRNRWDRVWGKGGSLANADGNYVFTLSWLFESDDKGAYVLVMMANNRDGSPIDAAPAFSIASRTEEILFAR